MDGPPSAPRTPRWSATCLAASLCCMAIPLPLLVCGVIITLSPNQQALGTVYDVQHTRYDSCCDVQYKYSAGDGQEFSGSVLVPCMPRPGPTLVVCYSRLVPQTSMVAAGESCQWTYGVGVMLCGVSAAASVTIMLAFAVTRLSWAPVPVPVGSPRPLPTTTATLPPTTTARVELATSAWDLACSRSSAGDHYVIIKHPSA